MSLRHTRMSSISASEICTICESSSANCLKETVETVANKFLLGFAVNGRLTKELLTDGSCKVISAFLSRKHKENGEGKIKQIAPAGSEYDVRVG